MDYKQSQSELANMMQKLKQHNEQVKREEELKAKKPVSNKGFQQVVDDLLKSIEKPKN